jgi:hypothetical protein
VRIVHISTGSGKPYVEEAQTSISYTPRGRFIVYEKAVNRTWMRSFLFKEFGAPLIPATG